MSATGATPEQLVGKAWSHREDAFGVMLNRWAYPGMDPFTFWRLCEGRISQGLSTQRRIRWYYGRL